MRIPDRNHQRSVDTIDSPRSIRAEPAPNLRGAPQRAPLVDDTGRVATGRHIPGRVHPCKQRWYGSLRNVLTGAELGIFVSTPAANAAAGDARASVATTRDDLPCLHHVGLGCGRPAFADRCGLRRENARHGVGWGRRGCIARCRNPRSCRRRTALERAHQHHRHHNPHPLTVPRSRAACIAPPVEHASRCVRPAPSR